MNKTNTTSIVIFGASGDLARRKLLPGLFNLYLKGRLPDSFHIVGNARTAWTDAEFRARMLTGVQEFSAETFDPTQWNEFSTRLSYVTGSFTDDKTFTVLKAALDVIEAGPANRLYYLSTAPRFFLTVTQHLAKADMVEESQGWRRVIVEKPFGHDLASAKALNHDLHQLLQEHQIYRIDHYLAKETVQNLLVFRFANT
ncbi:MAG TPA: glucose-6-phosphate dehydrogenase, partial [Anaerolineae bacterium]|nr:glucose-6-phosphate dehydrogenase [Anaerolineae bacterium]